MRRGGHAGAGKLAGLDKKLSRSLEASVAERGSPSSMDLGKSPMGPLTEATRSASSAAHMYLHRCESSLSNADVCARVVSVLRSVQPSPFWGNLGRKLAAGQLQTACRGACLSLQQMAAYCFDQVIWRRQYFLQSTILSSEPPGQVQVAIPSSVRHGDD